ncbi:MAG: hypothetical protein HQL63_00010 [Magnetococcales bacterium]|nr:hypothetical protein [Magnetococcales bacterium]MBF0323379.1 hypothetical protein [Magnetococcales bacterium]
MATVDVRCPQCGSLEAVRFGKQPPFRTACNTTHTEE